MCTISDECFAVPGGYRRLYGGGRGTVDQEEELLQMAIQQSLREQQQPIRGKEVVSVANHVSMTTVAYHSLHQFICTSLVIVCLYITIVCLSVHCNRLYIAIVCTLQSSVHHNCLFVHRNCLYIAIVCLYIAIVCLYITTVCLYIAIVCLYIAIICTSQSSVHHYRLLIHHNYLSVHQLSVCTSHICTVISCLFVNHNHVSAVYTPCTCL